MLDDDAMTFERLLVALVEAVACNAVSARNSKAATVEVCCDDLRISLPSSQD